MRKGRVKGSGGGRQIGQESVGRIGLDRVKGFDEPVNHTADSHFVAALSHCRNGAVTAHAMRHNREVCFAAGMDGYLSKPFGREELAQAMSAWRQPDATTHAPARPAANSATGCINTEVIERLRELEPGRGPGRVAKLIEIFRASSAKLQDQIQEGLDGNDADTVRESAHALKSSSAQLGAGRVSELALQLEEASRSGVSDSAPELADQLGAALEEALAALDRLVAEGTAS